MFSKKRYLDKKWRRKWRLIDCLVFASCILLANALWSLTGLPLIRSFAGILWEGLRITGQIQGSREKLTMLIFLALVLVLFLIIVILSTMPVLGIYLGIRSSARKNEKQRVSYNVIQDIDYFREEFSGLSPIMISMLMDLKIERKKDVTATLLSLEQRGLIHIAEGKIQVYKGSGEILTQSEKLLLDLIVNNQLNAVSLRGWENAGIREAIKEGLITYNKSKVRFMQHMILLIILAGIAFGSLWFFCRSMDWFDETGVYIDEILAPYEEQYDKDITGMSDKEQIEYIEEQLAIPELQETLILLCGMAGIVICGVLSLIMPFVIIASIIAFCVTKPGYKRTRKGKLLTEQIAGMKRFIHDFSNLNEAEKGQLALWDEFLVYAVVLEENETIVNEIGNVRRVDLSKYQFNA